VWDFVRYGPPLAVPATSAAETHRAPGDLASESTA